jgi:hypothetical protein
VHFSRAPPDHDIHVLPVVIGLVVAAAGVGLLWRERRARLAKFEDSREALPSWWF